MGAGIGVLFAAVIAMGTNTVGWAFSALAETEKLFDAVGASTFLLLMLFAWSWRPAGARPALAMLMVAIWAARLGYFLAVRAFKRGDRRLHVYIKDPVMLLVPFTGQWLWNVLTSLPVIILCSSGGDAAPLSAGWDYGALALWASGFIVQVIADQQKNAFAADPRNRGRFIQSGLWALSQHPNYVGQLALNLGLNAFCLPGNAANVGWVWALLLAALGVSFEAALLLFVSGVPLLQRQAKDKWGDDPRWRQYAAQTPVLLPGLPAKWLHLPGSGPAKRRA